MKRDRTEAFGSNNSGLLLPVLHFKTTEDRDRVVNALNAASAGETPLSQLFGDDLTELQNLNLSYYEVYGAEETKRFACLLCINGCDNLCVSAKFYNDLVKNFGYELKNILSIDHSNRYARLGSRSHSEDCMFPGSVSTIMRYMGLEPHDIPSVQNLKDACFQRAVISEMPFFTPNAYQQLQQVATTLTFLFDPNDLTGMPRQRAPEAPVETAPPLNDAWEKKLKPLDELVEGPDICQGCYKFEKTILMEPCCHMYYCDECFRKMMTSTTLIKECPMCKQKFDTIKRVIR